MKRLLRLVAAMVPQIGSAVAQEQPRILPARDVVAVYRVQGAAADAIPGGVPGNLRLSWSAAGQRLRVEPDGRPQALLVDLGTRSVQVVDSALRAAMALPVREADLQPLTLEGARLTRRSPESVAGLACTAYAVQSPRGKGTVCLTDDGVALRATGEVDGRAGSFTAVSVSYGALPPALFQVPPGYFQLALPGMGRAR